jgi:carbon-monoxide dehydrogenase large subunit
MRPNGTTPIRNMAQFLTGPYRVSAIHFEGRGIVTNKAPAGTYRGPGRYESSIACEAILDSAASKLGVDRLEIRRHNLLTQADMPYRLPITTPAEGAENSACDSGDYRQAFERCLLESRWTEKIPLQGRLIDGRWHGLGIGSFIEGGASGPQENARIVVEGDGVVVYAGSSAVGQGLETVLAQIAADSLELPLAKVTVRHGSTTYLDEGWGSYGSRATVMGGCAVQAAAMGLLGQFREAVATRLGVDPRALRIANGIAETREGSNLALWAMTGLASEGKFRNSKPTYSFGTAMAHVAVDPETGLVEVIDYLVVDDVGRIINPLTLHGQVQGAAIQGMGSVFREEIVYDEAGQLCVGSLMDYSVPLAGDYPHVRCISEENYPSPNNPLGAKGAGEGGIIPVGAVVLNAVAAALAPLAVRPRELPLTPLKIWSLIHGKPAAISREGADRDAPARRP